MKKVWDSNLNLLFDILLSIRYYSILCGSYGRQNKLLFNEDSCVIFFFLFSTGRTAADILGAIFR